MKTIPDFTDNELWVIQGTLKERYGSPIDVELAESELRLDLGSTQLTTCPTAYWRVGACHFVICKTGEQRYRCQFFYRVNEQYGTGVPEFTDLAECTVTLLQVQADHESRRQGNFPDAKA